MKINKIVTGVMVAVVSAGVATSAMAAKKNAEKCFGISKAKKNDCGTSKHACAGQASKNKSPQEWIYVLKGNCKRIVGGTLKAKT